MAELPEPEVPENELDAFLLSVAAAADLGAAGEVLDGYQCLLGGQEHAEELQEIGEPWAPELVAQYERALQWYGECWGLCIE